jgi:predicted transcriptional regulator
MAGKKTGRLSSADKAAIRKLRDEKSAEEIARDLGRDADTVRQYMGLGETTDPAEGARWEVIKRSFSKDEQAFFRQEFDRFTGQLEGDVLPTEEAQLIQALTLWILMNRVMTKQKNLEEDIERVGKYRRKLEEDLDRDDRRPTEDEERRLADYRSDVKGWKQDLNTLAGQFNDYSKERSSILKSLKVNRDQRIKEIESGNLTFVGLVKQLGRKDSRDRANREMELLKLAVEREQGRLMEPRIYPDGNEDYPLLCAETLERYDVKGDGDDTDDVGDVCESSGGGSEGDGGGEGPVGGEVVGPGRPAGGGGEGREVE